MSQYANPEKAYVWLDGDAFRGTAGVDILAIFSLKHLRDFCHMAVSKLALS
ncbi:hypothetical protein [Corynebacterium silvaticum]|uniref:Uncharacterized protein n=1 Tax=Corynebacterium silvaticum TaxID=2320431 RepID=A0ACD4PYQ8_9CORY|nr:hypothetical protein [Corynebacterium silvaticum]WCV10696.1 hypothetical protein CBE74_12120 [Corynebacterium silvaticum]